MTGETATSDPLVEFNGHPSADGLQTYWVDASGASTWERPAAFAWAEAPSEEHPGTSYYFNAVRRARRGPLRLVSAGGAWVDCAAAPTTRRARARRATARRPRGSRAPAARAAGDQGVHLGEARHPGLEGAPPVP